MSAIDDTFLQLAADKRKALVIFLTAGDPSQRGSGDLVRAAFDNGADIVELGVPFSDPLADGPVIQESFLRAIKAGSTVNRAFDLTTSIRKTHDAPLVFMLASTLILNHGVKKFMIDSASAGINGLIVPDAPLEEADEFADPARAAGIDTIQLVAPTTPKERLRKLAARSSGFVYYINITGVTGDKKASAKDTTAGIAALKKVTKLPVLAGFGITEPAQARKMTAIADGVIVGSQAIRVIRSAKNQKAAVADLGKFVAAMRKGLSLR